MAWVSVATTPGFTSPWTDYDPSGPWGPVRYNKDSHGVVHLQGLVGASPAGSGAATQVIFQLPAGYRPGTGPSRVVWACASWESGSGYSLGRIDVDTSGNFIYMVGGRGYLNLMDIFYYAAG